MPIDHDDKLDGFDSRIEALFQRVLDFFARAMSCCEPQIPGILPLVSAGNRRSLVLDSPGAIQHKSIPLEQSGCVKNEDDASTWKTW